MNEKGDRIQLLFIIGCMTNGGAERVISVLANGLADSCNIAILQIYRDKVDYELDSRIKVEAVHNETNNRVKRIAGRFSQIRRYVKRINPDLIISFIAEENIYTLLSLWNSKYKIIISERNDPEKSPESRQIRWLRDKVYKRADAMVFQTPDAKKYFSGPRYKRITKTIIPNPVKPDLPEHVFEKDCHRFISACRLYEQKNIPMMIEAVRLLIEKGILCTLDIYGEGPLRSKLERMVQGYGLSNYIHLNHFTKEIHYEMTHGAAFVISSDYEGISNSMLEALCIGIPVIATDCPVGGARMYIKDGVNGYLVPCNNVCQLAEKMERVLVNREESEKIGMKAKELKNDLETNKIIQKWKSLIRYMIGAPDLAAPRG